MTDDTGQKQKSWLFKPGQSGNPAGRPLGARNKLGEALISALAEDFNTNGTEAIKKVREYRPHEYLKIIASIIPKEFHVADMSVEDMTDEELLNVLASVRSLIASQGREEVDNDLATAPAANSSKH